MDNPFESLFFVLGEKLEQDMPSELQAAYMRLLRGEAVGDDLFAVTEYLGILGFDKDKLIRQHSLFLTRHKRKAHTNIVKTYMDSMTRANLAIGLKRLCGKKKSDIKKAMSYFKSTDLMWRFVCYVRWPEIESVSKETLRQIAGLRTEIFHFCAFLNDVQKAHSEADMRDLISRKMKQMGM